MTKPEYLEVCELVDRLTSSFGDLENNKTYYLTELLPEMFSKWENYNIGKSLDERATQKELDILSTLKIHYPTSEFSNDLLSISKNIFDNRINSEAVKQRASNEIRDLSFVPTTDFYIKYCGVVTKADVEEIRNKELRSLINSLTNYIKQANLPKANEIFKKYLTYFSEDNIDTIFELIALNLKTNSTKTVNEIFTLIKPVFSTAIYTDLKRRAIKNILETKLKNDCFYEADVTYNKNPHLFDQHEYEQLKAIYIQKYFYDNFMEKGQDFNLDLEQAEAVGALGQNILVSARAGSGKTRVLVSKILYLLEKEKLPWDSLCILAFNKKVPQEISERIREKVTFKTNSQKYQQFDLAQTFHKLARTILNYRGKVLAGEKESEKKLFIKKVIEYVKSQDKDFEKRVVDYFKTESFKVDRNKFEDPKAFYSYIRNQRYTTLKNEKVKSLGEKWIADFLFEHDIAYKYEKKFYPSYLKGRSEELNQFLKSGEKESTNPDFFLSDHNIVWEHWGIDENETNQEKKDEFSHMFNTSWTEYKRNMDWKRKFWRDWRKKLTVTSWAVEEITSIDKLIETSVVDLENGQYDREKFEMVLKELLVKNGINVQRKDEALLVQEVWEKTIDHFSEMMTQFINRYQQLFFNQSEEFKSQIEHHKDNSRIYEFLRLGLQVLSEYENQLSSLNKTEKLQEDFGQYQIDFNQMILKTVEKINSGEVDEQVKKYKWILIDEYQDFSELFLQLIHAIQCRNPSIKLFCVGDNWQAINRFAGSDTKYFDNFASYFKDYNPKSITTNYRSKTKLIDFSNQFMIGNKFIGKPAKPSTEDMGEVIKQDVNAPFVLDRRKDKSEPSGDQIYLNEFKRNGDKYENDYVIKAKYLKLCFEIIKNNKGKKFLLLHRSNDFKFMSLETFKTKLIILLIKKGEYLSQNEAETKIKVGTIHRAKGVESDIVILLEVVEGLMPMNHPDNELFEIFGEDIKTNLDDQKRLFYVAITRAREKLYILTEKEKESEYTKDINYSN